MKHFALIQSQFLKLSRFEDLTLQQQHKYLHEHPESKKHLFHKIKQSGEDIAKKLNVDYNGYQEGIEDTPGGYIFTDMSNTGSTFLARDFEEAEFKLERMRDKFKDKQLKHVDQIRSEFMKHIARNFNYANHKRLR